MPVISVDGSFVGSGPAGMLVKANPLAGVTGAQVREEGERGEGEEGG